MWHADLLGAGQGRQKLAGPCAVDGDLGQPRECLSVHGYLSRLRDRQVTGDQLHSDLLVVEDPEVLNRPGLTPVQRGRDAGSARIAAGALPVRGSGQCPPCAATRPTCPRPPAAKRSGPEPDPRRRTPGTRPGSLQPSAAGSRARSWRPFVRSHPARMASSLAVSPAPTRSSRNRSARTWRACWALDDDACIRGAGQRSWYSPCGTARSHTASKAAAHCFTTTGSSDSSAARKSPIPEK